jgi:endonuclease YncB( thermonuclease family)
MRIGRRAPLWVVVIGLLLAAILEQLNWFEARPGTGGEPPAGLHKITQIIDGDTIAVEIDGKEERVRLIGVDTPETQDPRKPVQCFGQAASDFTKRLIGEHDVRLEKDDLSSNRDRYNRILRYVYLPDGTLVNAEIIRQGYGYAYTRFEFTKMAEFKGYEQDARQAKRGLWGSCEPSSSVPVDLLGNLWRFPTGFLPVISPSD